MADLSTCKYRLQQVGCCDTAAASTKMHY